MKGKAHDLNHDFTFSAQTINWVCHSIRSMFRVLGIYNFGLLPTYRIDFKTTPALHTGIFRRSIRLYVISVKAE